MFIQPQKDNGLTCQTRFQVKSGKECSRTNTINYFSRVANRFGINEASYCCSPRKLAGLKGKLIALKDAVIPFRLYTRQTNKFHSQCLTLANGDWDQSLPIPQEVKSEISHWLKVLNQWNGKEISLFPSYDYVLRIRCRCHSQERKQDNQDLVIPVVNNSIEHVAKSSRNTCAPHSGDSVFIQNEGKPLDVKDINIIVLSTLSSSGIDISKFKSHSTRSAMASLLLSNNVPFHVVKKMGRWKSNDTVDTFYDKRIIGEKSGGFLNTVVQIS
ncbi:hypothetical protein ACTFIR_003929 [Dictyostelium discoideum]